MKHAEWIKKSFKFHMERMSKMNKVKIMIMQNKQAKYMQVGEVAT